MYINDVWSVEDVWNSQNIPKSKQRFLSNVFAKSDRSLQIEHSILSRQLTESQQARKKTERTLQEVMESHQQEIQLSNTRLQGTQSQLEAIQSQLQDTQVQLQYAQQMFQDSQQQTQVFVSDVYIRTQETIVKYVLL